MHEYINDVKRFNDGESDENDFQQASREAKISSKKSDDNFYDSNYKQKPENFPEFFACFFPWASSCCASTS